MTQKLYNENSYIKNFCSKVVDVLDNDDKNFGIILEQSCFFPGGGGQPCDTGYINNYEISEAYEANGKIIHSCKTKLPVGSEVKGQINFERRFASMQTHTGEHILSGLLFSLYGIKNIGFHIGHEFATIDTDTPLELKQIETLEGKCNEIIYSNINVAAYFPNKEKKKNLNIRKLPDIEGELRIVDIQGCDTTACCGMHVKQTGEVGLLKITDFKNYKKGTRIFFLCGIMAFDDYKLKHKILSESSVLLHSPIITLQEKIKQQHSSLNIYKKQINELEKRLAFSIANEFIQKNRDNSEFICGEIENADRNLLKNTSVIIAEASAKTAFMLSTSENGLIYSLASKNAQEQKLQTIAHALNTEFLGTGGGNKLYFQGELLSKDIDSVLNCFKKIYSKS